MFRRCKIISCLIFLTLSMVVSIRLSAQTNWDLTLNQYEEICDRCLDVKKRISAGESVPQSTITSLLQELGSLRNTLQKNSGSMTGEQKKRFESIRRKYSPDVQPNPPVEKQSITPKSTTKRDTAKDTPTSTIQPTIQRDSAAVALKKLDITLHDTLHYNSTIRLEVPECLATRPQEESNPRHKFHFSILPQMTISTPLSFGGFLSASSEKWGGYLSLLSSFTRKAASEECLSSGEIKGGGYFWGDGTSENYSGYYTAGVLYRINDYISAFAGGGYGEEILYWRDIEGNWAKVTDYSNSGFAAQAGIIGTISHVSVGISIIYLTPASSIIPSVAVGYTF